MKYAVSYEGYFKPSGAKIIECETDVEALVDTPRNNGISQQQ